MINVVFKDKAQQVRKRAFPNQVVANAWIQENSHWCKFITITTTNVVTKKKVFANIRI